MTLHDRLHDWLERWTSLHGTSINLFVLLILLNVIDYQTTSMMIGVTGYGVEANPVLRYLAVLFDSVWAILVFKILALSIAVWLWRYAIRRARELDRLASARRTIQATLMFLCVVYALICIHNTYGIYVLYTHIAL